MTARGESGTIAGMPTVNLPAKRLTRALLLAASSIAIVSVAAIASAERSVDGEEELLPIWETPEEIAFRSIFQRKTFVTDPPPTPPLRNVAEFEPCTGALIRYPLGIPYNLIREMTEDVIVHVIVSSSFYSAAVSNFIANSVDTSRVEFIVAPNNSIWTRDYGPWFVFDGNGDLVILDHFYNRPQRPADNVIPSVLGGRWGIPVVEHDLWHTGGNYMTEGHGLSYSSDLVWNENTIMTQAEIAQFMLDYYGVDTYNVLPDIDIDPEAIHHIDTWGKLLDEETILMKQIAAGREDYARVEANVALVQGLTNKYGRPFKIVRVFCPTIPSTDPEAVAAYTNSLILNDKVLVPVFNRTPWDSLALEAYKQNMPGYEVLSFTYSGWITDDALHCRVMGIADRYMLRVDHNPVQSATSGAPAPVSVYIDDRSETGIDLAQTALHWRVAGAPAFEAVPLSPDAEADWYVADIPSHDPGTQVEYYVIAADNSGRVAARPRPAPAAGAVHRFTFQAPTGTPAASGAAPSLALAVEPSVIGRGRGATIRFRLDAPGHARIAVYDLSGREVARLADRALPLGEHALVWDARENDGRRVASGLYLVAVESSGVRATARAVVIE
jgi:agmatine/peptidylarginine deiminase